MKFKIFWYILLPRVLILGTGFEATSRGHYGEESKEGKKGCEEEDR